MMKVTLQNLDGETVAAGEYDFGNVHPPYPTFIKYRGDVYQLVTLTVHEMDMQRWLTYQIAHPNFVCTFDHLWGRDREAWPKTEDATPPADDRLPQPMRGELHW